MRLLDSIRSFFSKEKQKESENETEETKEAESDTSPSRREADLVVTGTTNIVGVGTVVNMRITSGSLETGDTIRFENGSTAEVETIELYHKEVEKAKEGNVVGLELEGIDASGLSEGTEATATETTPETE